MWALQEILKPLEDEYDYMLFDTSPSEGLMAYNALAAADEVIIPVAASSFSEDGLAQAVEAIERAKQKYNSSLRLRNILLTKSERTVISSVLLSSIMENYPEILFPTSVIKSTVVDQANELGRPIVIHDPAHRAALAYFELARSITDGK
jgi:chromosome partitioning protein